MGRRRQPRAAPRQAPKQAQGLAVARTHRPTTVARRRSCGSKNTISSSGRGLTVLASILRLMDAPVTLRAALVAASLVLVVVGPERSGAAAPAADRFTLGILRRDGLVTPFATFDGKHWNNTWPKPVRHVDEVPVTLGSVPRWWWGRPGPRETWLASIGSAERRELHVTGTNVYDAQCLQQIGLRTDYRPSAPPPGPGARPYPKDGLAVSPPYPIEPIEVMPIPTLPRQLVDAFNGSEALALRHAPVEPLK